MKTFRTVSGYLLKMDSNQIKVILLENGLKSEKELSKIGYTETKK